MALEDIRISWRVHLSDAARGIDADANLVTLRRFDEPIAHLWLRLIAWGLWYTPTLRFVFRDDPDAPALEDEDLTGRRTVFVAVDPDSAERMAYAVRHNRGAVVGAAFGGAAALAAFREKSRTVKGIESVEFAVVDAELLDAMAEALPDRRYDVSLTIVEDQLYLSVGEQGFTGSVLRSTGLPR